jgi:hypothetical protein
LNKYPTTKNVLQCWELQEEEKQYIHHHLYNRGHSTLMDLHFGKSYYKNFCVQFCHKTVQVGGGGGREKSSSIGCKVNVF